MAMLSTTLLVVELAGALGWILRGLGRQVDFLRPAEAKSPHAVLRP